VAKTRVTSQDVGDGLLTAADMVTTGTPGVAAFGAAAAQGSSASVARLDHAHGMPANPATPVFAVLPNGTTAMALGTNNAVKVTPTASATFTTTVPAAGRSVYVLILTAGASSFTITFGAGFKPSATLVTGTTAARVFVLEFVSDGTNLYEVSRTAALVA
jgi:hypothetical protein